MDNVYAPPQNLPTSFRPGDQLKWPKVLGILNLVFGILGFLGSFFAFATTQFLKLQFKFLETVQEVPEEMWKGIEEFEANWSWYFYLSGSLSLVLNAALILAAINCLKMKRVCRPLFFLFAFLMTVFVGLSIWITLGTSMMEEQLAFSMTQEDADLEVFQLKFGRIIAVISAGIYLILPAFLVIWFLRSKIISDLHERFS